MVNKKLRTPYMIAQEKLKKKEIDETKKYIKKIWGADIKLKEMSYKEIKRLGGELGMNVFNVKSFTTNKEKLKTYTRICDKCGKNHKVERNNKVRPCPGYLCNECKIKSDNKRTQSLKNKNKKEWEKLILNALKKDEKLFASEIAERIGCSTFPMRQRLKAMSREGKIKMSKKVTYRI